MDAGDWISIFMALIATASAGVAHAVFRSSTDPVIIVYANPDTKRPSIINLIIKNIGNGAAHNIQFKPTKPLPHRAFGIAVPEEMPEPMESGPIATGIPFLAPGQEITITWGQYGGIYKYIGDTPIRIESKYYTTGSPRFYSRKMTSTSSLDVRTFEQSESSEYGYGPSLVAELKTLNKSITAIKREVQQITKISENQNQQPRARITLEKN